MFKHDTMEKYVADSIAEQQAATTAPSESRFDFFQSGDAVILLFASHG